MMRRFLHIDLTEDYTLSGDALDAFILYATSWMLYLYL